jgi:thiamine biosynthesis protein ThiS
MPVITANGKELKTETIPCSLETFLREQGLMPKSVVVELNGNAIPPSEFADHLVKDGDRMEIVKIVAGG